jgi:hypothetical protein
LPLLKKRFFRLFITVLFPLLTGVLIYLFCSPSTRYFFQFFPKLSVHFPLKNWISFSLPDGLWTFSFVSFVLFLFQEKSRQKTLFILIAFFSGSLLEIFQLYHFIPGTFDLMDILFHLAWGTMALFFGKLFSQEKELYLHRFRISLSAIGCFVFLLMAFANEPDDSKVRLNSAECKIMIINKTGKPVQIIEEGKINAKLDSGTAHFHANYNSADSNNYFVFLFTDSYGYQLLKNGVKTASIKQIDKWRNEGKLSQYSFFIEPMLSIPEEQRTTYQLDSSGNVTRINFWLQPTNSFDTEIPANNPENGLKNEDFSVYRIYYVNKNGKADSLKLRGKEFYKFLDKKNKLILQ